MRKADRFGLPAHIGTPKGAEAAGRPVTVRAVLLIQLLSGGALLLALVVAIKPVVILCAVAAVVTAVMGAWTLWNIRRRKRAEVEMARLQAEVRPRFGQLHRADGTSVPLVFHPTADPVVFVGRYAGSEAPARIEAGDSATVDVIGPGQAVVFETPPP